MPVGMMMSGYTTFTMNLTFVFERFLTTLTSFKKPISFLQNVLIWCNCIICYFFNVLCCDLTSNREIFITTNPFFFYSSWWSSCILMGIRLRCHMGLPYLHLHLTCTTNLWSWIWRNLLQRTSRRRRRGGGRRSLICDYQIHTLSGDLCSNNLSKLLF